MSEEPSTYYTPDHIVNPATGTGDMTPAAGLVNPPYYAVPRVLHVANLGIKLAQLTIDQHATMLPVEEINRMMSEIEQTAREILSLSESGAVSNE